MQKGMKHTIRCAWDLVGIEAGIQVHALVVQRLLWVPITVLEANKKAVQQRTQQHKS